MRTDNNSPLVFTMLLHMAIELLFTGEVYQCKDLKVYSSIFLVTILSLQYNSFHEKTSISMEYFYDKTSLNMKCFYGQNDSCLSGGCTYHDVKSLYFLLIKIFLNLWNKACGRFQLEAPRAYICSGFLAYVTRPHDWRIRVARGKVKPL